MKKLYQLNEHIPEKGLYGDCDRTTVACLMDLDCPSQVPNWAELYWDNDKGEWTRARQNFLSSFGITSIVFPVMSNDIQHLLDCMESWNKDTYYLLTGASANYPNINHVIIGYNNEIVWDPSPSQKGIVGPCYEDDLYWIEFLIGDKINHGR